jgi:hypothetical protein
MAIYGGAMHVARNKRSYVAKSGEERVYETVLLRRTYREAGVASTRVVYEPGLMC